MAGQDGFHGTAQGETPAAPSGAIEGGGGSGGTLTLPGGLRMMRTSPLLSEALRYWTSLCHGGDLPRRADLDPARMTHILGHAMILDRVRPGSIRVRLGGHVLQSLMGMDVRGLPVRAFFDLADRTRVGALIEDVFDSPATLEMDLISDGPDGIITGRMILLPLLDTARRTTKALAVMVTDRAVTDAPRRFSLTHAVALPVHGAAASHGAMPDRPLSPPVAAPETGHGLAERAEPYRTRPSPVPWLRVVK